MTTHNIGALVVRLQATPETLHALQRKRGRLHAFMGNAVHQAFHASVGDDVAAVLHNDQIHAQPFAASPLFRWRLDVPFYGEVVPDERVWIRWVGLHPYVIEALERWRKGSPQWLNIDRTPWRITQVGWDAHHLYASRWDAGQLYQQHMENPAPPCQIHLRFLTPTQFKSQGNIVQESTPRLVLGEGLVRRWRSFYPQYPVPDGYAEYLAQHVTVERERAYQHHSILLKNAVVKGFTSDVVYQLEAADDSDDVRRFAGLMATYASFAGVGKKTTMGLGMVDRVQMIRG